MFGKKREFKPDRNGTELIRHLHLTAQQRAGLLKWGLCSLVVLAVSVVQDVVLCRISLHGATTDLVPAAILLAAILASPEGGAGFALAASTVYVLSGMAPGVYVIALLTLMGGWMNMFRRSYLRGSGAVKMLCAMVTLAAYELLLFAIGLVMSRTTPARFSGFCITAGLSALAMPLLYPIFVGISRIGGDPWND